MTDLVRPIDCCNDAKMLFPNTFSTAAKLSRLILSSERYFAVLKTLFEEIDLNQAYVYLRENSISASVIEQEVDMTAYALVYPVIVDKIFFNPILLSVMVRRESTVKLAGSKRKVSSSGFDKVELVHIAFLMVKIIHEVSHLVNLKCNNLLTGNKRTLERKIGQATFKDFGDMVEYYLFGGISEHYGDEVKAFDIKQIILFERPGAPQGHLVHLNEDILTMDDEVFIDRLDKSEFSFFVRGELLPQKSTGNRKKSKASTQLPIANLTTDEDESNEDETGELNQTFMISKA